MKIRTKEEFFDRLDRESSWRKKELTSLIFGLRDARPMYETIFMRSGIALAYAHWEGFIKNSSEFYVIYLSSRRLKGEAISTSFRDSFLLSRIANIGDIKHIKNLRQFMSYLEKELPSSDIYLDHKKTVTTKSNLKFEVFSDLMMRLGIDSQKYSTKNQIIDAMVDHRNGIAHGDNVPITKEHAEEYIELARELIENYKTDLTNAVATDAFLKTA